MMALQNGKLLCGDRFWLLFLPDLAQRQVSQFEIAIVAGDCWCVEDDFRSASLMLAQ